MPSRRDTLGTVAVGVAATLAGCSRLRGTDAASDGATRDTSDATTETAGDATAASPSFAVVLVGPERRRTLFTAADTASVGDVRRRQDAWTVPIQLTASAADAVSETFTTAGVADDPAAFEAVVRVDDETVNRFGIAPSLAEAIASGEYGGSFVLTFGEESAAARARRALTSA